MLVNTNACRSCDWPRAVPVMPGEAPISAATLPFNALVRGGLDGQSIVFFSTPGTPWLYAQTAGESDNVEYASDSGHPVGIVRRDARRVYEEIAHVNRLTNSRAFSATSCQPASIASVCPRPGILTISVTLVLRFCFR